MGIKMRMLTKVRKKHMKEVERKEELLKIRLHQLKIQKISILRFAKKMMFVNTIYIVCKTLMLYSLSWILQKNVLKTVIHTMKRKFMNATKDLWENRLLSMEQYFWLLLLCIYLVNYEYIQKR